MVPIFDAARRNVHDFVHVVGYGKRCLHAKIVVVAGQTRNVQVYAVRIVVGLGGNTFVFGLPAGRQAKQTKWLGEQECG